MLGGAVPALSGVCPPSFRLSSGLDEAGELGAAPAAGGAARQSPTEGLPGAS